jgi:hypothetical protein
MSGQSLSIPACHGTIKRDPAGASAEVSAGGASETTRPRSARNARRFSGSSVRISRTTSSIRRRTTAASRSNAEPAPCPASSRRFERARQRRRGLPHVVVDDRLKFWRLVPSQERGQQEEQLRLARTEGAPAVREQPMVALPTVGHDRRWVVAGAREPGAVVRALNPDQSLGAAAWRADLLAERRAPASGTPDAAQRTVHPRIMPHPRGIFPDRGYRESEWTSAGTRGAPRGARKSDTLGRSFHTIMSHSTDRIVSESDRTVPVTTASNGVSSVELAVNSSRDGDT